VPPNRASRRTALRTVVVAAVLVAPLAGSGGCGAVDGRATLEAPSPPPATSSAPPGPVKVPVPESASGSGSAELSLAGTYTIVGATGPGGASTYSGTVDIDIDGELSRVRWTIPNTPPQAGVGLVERAPDGDVLVVGYGAEGAGYGVVAYRVDGGTLTGRWADSRGTAPGREELRGPDGLSGTYQAAGTNPDGSPYAGTVEISPAGDVFTVRWRVGSSEYSGVGFRDRNLLVVGYATVGDRVGIAAYRAANEAVLLGRWTHAGATTVGTESLRKG
jgi:hypothetical protein